MGLCCKKDTFIITDKRLKPAVNYPIPVKSEKNRTETIGYLSSKDEVMILDYWYGRLKLLVPGEKVGWIFNGTYDDPWTTAQFNEFNDYYFAEFSRKNILSNLDITMKRSEFSVERCAGIAPQMLQRRPEALCRRP